MSFHHRMPPHLAAEHARELAKLHALRREIADRIEADIALLDRLDGDPDLEPSLCGREVGGPSIGGDDRERETEHDEPSLGWPDGSAQTPLPGTERRHHHPAGLDGRRCAHGAWDLEAGDDTGIGDREALDMVEAPGRWAA